MKGVELKPGERVLDRYEVLKLIGSGGAGQVYQVRELAAPRRTLALKLLRRPDNDDERKRFEREVKLVKRMRSLHSVTLMDSGFWNGIPFMVLEFLKGQTLDDFLEKRGALPPPLVRHIFIQILDAVAEAHEWGVVHRDLKPANIMLTGPDDKPHVKVLDFGEAGFEKGFTELGGHKRITLVGEVRGTPNYMAPEQVKKFDEPHVETDIYALGLIMLECLTGERVIDGPTVEVILFKHVKEHIANLIPEHVANSPFGPIIERATYQDPTRRYPKAESMLSFVERISEDGTRLEEATFETQSTTTIEPEDMFSEDEFEHYRELYSGDMPIVSDEAPAPSLTSKKAPLKTEPLKLPASLRTQSHTHETINFSLPAPPERAVSNQVLFLATLMVLSLLALGIYAVVVL